MVIMMHLKRIEAIGFKSFATKTIINFDKGLTAIVGPNGSGKSNVSDSIRFVLGEQSVKSLRGGKMEDVIFAGTDDKRPLNMAEVTIVLDNESKELPLDYNEISITRRIFRSGGGEYLINGEKARLKDVTDLIMDSGIGHDSLSMISQDQVKQVIEGKPEDRRLILEESAGILKYKTRKKEAVRKLGYTNENLRRAKDIIGELENQIEPLRVQAKEAREYLDLKEKLSDQEIRLLAHDIKIDNDALNSLKKENEILTGEILKLSNLQNEDESRHERLTESHQEITHFIQDLQFELTNIAEMTQKKRGESDVIRERMNNANINKATLEARVEQLTKNIKNLENELENAKDLAQSSDNEIEQKKIYDQEAFKIKFIKPLEAKLETQNLIYRQKEDDVLTHKQKISQTIEDAQRLHFRHEGVKNQLQFLIDAKEDFVGFSEGTKQILRAKKAQKLSGIEGAIAELVTIDPKFETAFEVILGPLASQIITQNEHAAKHAINYLKKHKQGRATFLPLTNMKSRLIPVDIISKLKTLDGFITIASDALTYDPLYKNVIENLVGHIIIAKNLDDANSIARNMGHRYRIVTLSGDVINPGGSMTGGAINQKFTSAVLKQNQQIVYHQELLLKLEDKLLNFEESKQNLEHELHQFEETLLNQENVLQEIKNQISKLSEDQLRLSYEVKVELATLVARRDSQLENVKRINLQYNDHIAELKRIKHDLANSDDHKLTLLETLEKNEIEIKQSEDHKNEITLTIRQNREKLVTLTEDIKILELETRENRRMWSELNSELNKFSGEMGKLDVKIDLAIAKLEQEYEMTFDYATEHYPLRADVAGARAEVLSYQKQLSRYKNVNIGALDEYDRVKERYDFLERESSDLTLAADNLQASINEMDAEMVVKFKETFDLVRVHYIETFKELFGGGQADLILTDPTDLLNTGVDIIARPPGTKLGTSTLLSGGQKALTSIAMLFGILKIRAIPFCILDEVEAALDEANVNRYASYLKKFSDQTQFIIITHRRGTMEAADILYGVTMQERGITSMISVKMDGIESYVESA